MKNKEMLERLRRQYPHLKRPGRDPVEDTEEYKNIEDELQRELDEIFKDSPRRLGFCHVYWATKKRILKEKYGIDWKSPKEMNPGVIYD